MYFEEEKRQGFSEALPFFSSKRGTYVTPEPDTIDHRCLSDGS